MQTHEEDRTTITIDRVLLREVRVAADRAGMEPDDLIELAITRGLSSSEPDEPRLAREQTRRRPGGDEGLFFDWSR